MHGIHCCTCLVDLVCFCAAALHEVLRERLQGGLTDHSVKSCILCNPDAATSNGVDSYDEYHAADEVSRRVGTGRDRRGQMGTGGDMRGQNEAGTDRRGQAGTD